MFKIIPFNQSTFITEEPDQCIILRRLTGENLVRVSFPFIEDMPVLRLSVSEALTLRNAIDDLVSPLLLEVSKGAGRDEKRQKANASPEERYRVDRA